jgi:polysaccharide export outer membrane protein
MMAGKHPKESLPESGRLRGQMINDTEIFRFIRKCDETGRRNARMTGVARMAALLAVSTALISGCVTPPPTPLTEEELTPFGSVKLREGDVLIINFSGSPNLNTTQPIRRDGKIALPLVGELVAAGKKPADLEKDVLALYKDQLVVKEVFVNLQSSAYPVFVSGAVVKPGKIMCDRPMSALEAIMEAGGFDLTKANMKGVVVVREQGGQLKHYVLNLKLVFEGKSTQVFYVRPSDIVFVPEKRF